MIAVADLEGLEGLGLRLVAGAPGAGRSIRWVASTELADPTPWLRGGELLLTTGLGMEADPAAYVEQLASAGLAGMAYALGIHRPAIPGSALATAERLGFPVLEVPYETPFVAITEAVMTRIVNEQYVQLERAMAVHDALIGLVLDESGLDAIIAATADAVGATIVAADRDGRVLARAGAIDCSHELRRALTADGRPDDLDLGPRATALEVGVSSPGEAILVAVAGRRLREWDRVQLQQARTVVALELAKRRAVAETEQRVAGDLVEEIVAGGADERHLQRRLRGFGVPDSAGLAVVLLRPALGEADRTVALGAIHRLAAATVAGIGVAAVRHGEVCAIVAADDDVAAEARAGVLRGAVTDGGPPPTVAVGRVRATATALADAYDEAYYALEARTAAGDDSAIATVRDLGSLGLLLSLQDQRGIELFCQSVLGGLDERDRRSAGSLTPTLAAFIECNGRAGDAAALLGVHRHTLRHRLRRIEEATGRDLTNVRDRLELWLALKAREIVQRRRA